MSDTTLQRWHGLDAVRGLALVAGVILHAAMAFLPGPQVWLIADATRSTTLSVAFFAIHMARMTLFFVLAGFFARLVMERGGWRAFVRNRALRIALPLVIFWPMVWFGILLVMDAATPGDGGGIPRITLTTVPLTHLWFLWLLLWLYAGTLLARALVHAIDQGGALRSAVDRATRVVVQPWAPLVLALPVAWALYAHPYWFPWFGVPTPDTGLLPNRAAQVIYGLAVAMGWLLHRQRDLLLPRLARQWPWFIACGIVAVVACLALTGTAPLLAPAPFGGAKLRFAAIYAVGLWGWAFGLIGLALRFLGSPSPARRYLADASYWIYIAHLPLVMALQLVIRDWLLPWPAKYFGLLAVTMAMLLVSYHWLVRPTLVGVLLNGRRIPRSRPHPLTSGPVPMKTLSLLLLAPALLSAQRAVAPAPLPLDTVIARHLVAVGPIERMQTRRATMTVTGMAPFAIPVTVHAMRPDLLLKEVTLQGAVQRTGYDGARAWRVDPFASASGKATDVPDAELEDLMEETDFDGPLVGAAAKGNRLRYVGPRVVDVQGVATPVHAVELVMANGRKAEVHLHGTTYLEVLRTQTRPVMGSQVAMTITPSDYRTVQGIRMPFVMEIAVAGMPTPIRIAFERVEFDVAMDRRQFARPR